ncbi:hypothetical protein OHAE_3750 [Ochrobactrum soli]|uniref:Uncharacterized protein n=1 Tax=Ochrobactrum soli TaxID=2448455 RepID=A0A2P9HI89_9HYPH|nr:hypothetical protein OHAE_3750 [[Ochrobactrum] soli]
MFEPLTAQATAGPLLRHAFAPRNIRCLDGHTHPLGSGPHNGRHYSAPKLLSGLKIAETAIWSAAHIPLGAAITERILPILTRLAS